MANFVDELCEDEAYKAHGECLTRVAFEDEDCANTYFTLYDDSNKTVACTTSQASGR